MINNAHPQSSPQNMAALGLLWLEKQSAKDKWNLSQEEVATLLGGMNKRTVTNWLNKAKNENQVEVPSDTLERLSLLLGIDKALAMSAPTGHRYEFFNRPNHAPLFEDQSIKDYLISRQSMMALYAVRRYLDARRG